MITLTSEHKRAREDRGMKRMKIDEATATRAARILAQSREVRDAMRGHAERALRQNGHDPKTVPEGEISALMVHGVASVLKREDALRGEWIDDALTARLIDEEAPKLRDPKTGLIDEGELVEAVVERQAELLHKHAPKASPWASKAAGKKAKKRGKRMKNRGTSRGPQLKMVKDLTIEDLEHMGGPESLGEEAGAMIELIRRCNPGVPERRLRKMTMEAAFAPEHEGRG
jgi:hypothetical protein